MNSSNSLDLSKQSVENRAVAFFAKKNADDLPLAPNGTGDTLLPWIGTLAELSFCWP